ncbi:MAG: hypothetical protein ACD_28C00420G0009, partial [uncultured bacterium]
MFTENPPTSTAQPVEPSAVSAAPIVEAV